jgi:hypothetical protein
MRSLGKILPGILHIVVVWLLNHGGKQVYFTVKRRALHCIYPEKRKASGNTSSWMCSRNDALRLQLSGRLSVFFFFRLLFPIIPGIVELAHALTHAAHQLWDFFSAKQEKDKYQYDQDFIKAKTTHKIS